jgi:hypothetical protein
MSGDEFLIVGNVWLITPMQADAEAGAFGVAKRFPFERLGTPLCDPRQLSRDKVELFKLRPDILARPVLLSQADDGAPPFIFDGHHRLTALQESGAGSFRAWDVPTARAWSYRLRRDLLNRAVASLLNETADRVLMEIPSAPRAEQQRKALLAVLETSTQQF